MWSELRSKGRGGHTQKGCREMNRERDGTRGKGGINRRDGVAWHLQTLQLPCRVEVGQMRRRGSRRKAWRGSPEEECLLSKQRPWAQSPTELQKKGE